MNATAAVALAILGVLWFALLILTFRPPDTPKVSRLLFFQLWLAASFILGLFLFIRMFGWNSNPFRVEVARWMTKDNMIYLGDFVPGLYDLDYMQRLDTDNVEEPIREEWLTFYQYDVTTNTERDSRTGPFGGAIYDYDDCRPQAIPSYELIAVSYDYLGQTYAAAKVENIIQYADPLSGGADTPEVLISGFTRGVVSDLNIFRKTGVGLNCLERQQWLSAHPGQAFPNPYRYANIGSFRGNHRVERTGSTVTVVDRAGFERSQFVVRRQYRPEYGTYFKSGTQTLLEPVEYTLAFAQGMPDEVTEVYYPEKAVLAFYLNLGKDKEKLEQAASYLSDEAQLRFDIRTDPFGLSTNPDSVATARAELDRTLVWQIRYVPEVPAEQLHQERQVQVTVVGVNQDGVIDYDHPCDVTWSVIGYPNSGALPYGCEWRLDEYQSSCPQY